MNDNKYQQSGQAQGDPRPSLFSRVTRMIVRLSLLIIFGAILGAGAFYGVPALYRDFIEPVQTNSDRISALEDALLKVQEENRNSALDVEERLAAIEGQEAAQQEKLSEFQAEIVKLQSQLGLADKNTPDLQSLAVSLGEIEEALQANAEEVAFLKASLAEPAASVQALEYKLQLVRTMGLLTRARLWLTQNNYGLAMEEIQLASQTLQDADEIRIEQDTGALQEIVERLDLALQSLPYNPVIAADDLEIAWQMLVSVTAP